MEAQEKEKRSKILITFSLFLHFIFDRQIRISRNVNSKDAPSFTVFYLFLESHTCCHLVSIFAEIAVRRNFDVIFYRRHIFKSINWLYIINEASSFLRISLPEYNTRAICPCIFNIVSRLMSSQLSLSRINLNLHIQTRITQFIIPFIMSRMIN